jgi:phosphatidylserine/phosphatidylglycerophosphate/cardiolipin synthase-like enzyme
MVAAMANRHPHRSLRSSGSAARRRRSVNRYLRRGLAVVAALWLGTMVWHGTKPLPRGVSFAGPPTPVANGGVDFLRDLTYRDGSGEEVVEQEIFDELFSMIDAAESILLLDLFLFNDHAGSAGRVHRPLSDELVEALLERKEQRPDLDVLFITDPINDVYGGDPSSHLDELRRAGVEVVLTDLRRLRDSNLGYSAAWRMFVQWFGNDSQGGWLPHPFRADGPRLSLRSYLHLFNFKANHRKVVVADDGAGGLAALVTSANPHDASSAHSNVALRVAGEAARQVLDGELAVARFSGWGGELDEGLRRVESDVVAGSEQVRYLTEGAILDALLDHLSRIGEGDRVDVAMFYLAERRFVESLLDAAERGAEVRLILDPNRDAFGREKDGVPNRPVADELVSTSDGRIAVRWYETHGEQFHTKVTVVRTAERTRVSLGSANLTRRNVGDLNLEANVEVSTPRGSPLDVELERYFETLWHNQQGALYTVDYERYRDPSRLRYWRYRFMEATGLSTF